MALKLILMGTGPFAAPTFEWILRKSPHQVSAVITRPVPPPVGRVKAPVNPIRDLAEKHGVPIFAPESINEAAAVEHLKALAADLYVVCDYGQILSREVLFIPRLGGINLHGSLLPRHRGAAPIVWAILSGDKETGVTVIHMTPGLDAGPMIVKVRWPISDQITCAELEKELAARGPAAVASAMEMLEKWDGVTTIGEQQDPQQATKAPRINKAMGEIDWSKPARQLALEVRAFQPWPGSFSFLQRHGKEPIRVALQSVIVQESTENSSPPGSIIAVDKESFLVAAGEGALQVLSLQPAGKKAMQATEFLRGYGLKPGMIFAKSAS